MSLFGPSQVDSIRHIQVLILSGMGFAELYPICVIPL